jgi:hypothetical protein
MKATEIFSLLSNIGVATFDLVIADEEYSLPTRRWFLGTFAAALNRDLDLLGVQTWKPELNDCDDFALLTTALARVCNALSNPKQNALAVGMFCYMPDGGGYHAINFAIVSEAGQRKVLFLEPQTQQEVKLSEREISSCAFYYI